MTSKQKETSGNKSATEIIERNCSSIVRAYSMLDPMSEALIYLRLNGKTLNEIGAFLNVSGKRAYQYQKQASSRWCRTCHALGVEPEAQNLLFNSVGILQASIRKEMVKDPSFSYLVGCITSTGFDSDLDTLKARNKESIREYKTKRKEAEDKVIVEQVTNEIDRYVRTNQDRISVTYGALKSLEGKLIPYSALIHAMNSINKIHKERFHVNGHDSLLFGAVLFQLDGISMKINRIRGYERVQGGYDHVHLSYRSTGKKEFTAITEDCISDYEKQMKLEEQRLKTMKITVELFNTLNENQSCDLVVIDSKRVAEWLLKNRRNFALGISRRGSPHNTNAIRPFESRRFFL